MKRKSRYLIPAILLILAAQALINDATLVSPRDGRILSLVDLTDVYMTSFRPPAA